MKISQVVPNNRRRAFEVRVRAKVYVFPYAIARPMPTKKDPLRRVWIDVDLGGEGFSYALESGAEGTVHIDHVLEYNRDPNYVTDMLLYKLTLEAQRRVERSPLSTRELIRRMGTSATQFYRLLDQTNYRKSVRQMLSLLHLLHCEVDFVVRERKSA
jgi:hypothetical protein